MASLFTLPEQIPLNAGAALPGATLTFTQTGTSTPQNVYQDSDLTTPHQNPVEADGTGVFPAIYLDPSLPAYRVKLATAAGGLVYQLDGVPSNQNTSQQFRLKSTAPSLIFEETDASGDNGKWRIRVNNEQMLIELLNDAENITRTLLTLDRTGMTADTVLAGVVTGTFTGTLTGMSSGGTGSVTYTIINNHCTLRALFSGTSNSTTLTMTGLPAAVRPTASAICVPCALEDNGAFAGGWADITSGSDTITFGIGINNNTTGFTSSAGKGLASGWTISYPLS